MKPPSSKLEHRQIEQTAETRQTQAQAAGREFASPEEMLRFDAAQTEVPETVKARLADSLEKEPPSEARASWWRRLFL